MHNPFYRTVLSAALDWHMIVRLANQPESRTLRQAIVTIALAAEIHEAPIPVRMVAWEQYTLVSTDGKGSVEVNGQPWPAGNEAWKAGKLRHLLLKAPGAMLSALEQVEAEEEAQEFIELPCRAVEQLATRVAKAVFSDEAEEGCDNQIGIGLHGPRFSAILVEMAGHEAEAYALQDQVEEANASVTALEQRIAELEAAIREVIHPRAPRERISIKRHQAMCRVLTLVEAK